MPGPREPHLGSGRNLCAARAKLPDAFPQCNSALASAGLTVTVGALGKITHLCNIAQKA